MNIELLNQASAFICQEADMLDHGEYPEWLALWEDKGLYIVPINPDETDFANTLNYACDNAAMREKRVARLGSGESISTSPVPRTIRSVPRSGPTPTSIRPAAAGWCRRSHRSTAAPTAISSKAWLAST